MLLPLTFIVHSTVGKRLNYSSETATGKSAHRLEKQLFLELAVVSKFLLYLYTERNCSFIYLFTLDFFKLCFTSLHFFFIVLLFFVLKKYLFSFFLI